MSFVRTGLVGDGAVPRNHESWSSQWASYRALTPHDIDNASVDSLAKVFAPTWARNGVFGNLRKANRASYLILIV